MIASSIRSVRVAHRITNSFQTSLNVNRCFGTSVYIWRPQGIAGVSGIVSGGQTIEKLTSIPKSPQRMEQFDDLNIKKLVIGNRHSALLGEDGKLYTFGNGNCHVLGHGSEGNVSFKEPKLVKKLVNSKVKVQAVALGEYHSVALDQNGQVWTWGYGGAPSKISWLFKQDVGALGHDDIVTQDLPKKVDFFQENGLKVTQIAAGNYHTVALADDGNVYSWGRGQYGVLGNGSNSHALVPTIINDIKLQRDEYKSDGLDLNVKKISAADDFTAALMSDGQLLVWGKNDRGQLGIGSGLGIDMVESEGTPTEVDFQAALPEDEQDDPVIIADVTTGSRTMMAYDTKGRVFKTGLKIDYTPKLIDFNRDLMKNPTQLSCGQRQYSVLDGENNLHCFGKMFSVKAEQSVDGFGIFDCDTVFEEGKVLRIDGKYETQGAIVQHK